ncbi:hypothetical protein IAQ61_010923 [Plenodomus lingam]|uniref:uncharacterized protein n=1 Tax=Leptosphaeria maculans TaxID=5022 RepID=UPI003320B602|nr:hypothetical protein IAQ61_010923 [Plenodomus lingam]
MTRLPGFQHFDFNLCAQWANDTDYVLILWIRESQAWLIVHGTGVRYRAPEGIKEIHIVETEKSASLHCPATICRI